ncbi:MAG: hypothetical protein CUN56_03885 [Phototrophicales bacterium]|nr:MAG: hypothetical protein CUN56_03885 [Phototrophicales bacterium]
MGNNDLKRKIFVSGAAGTGKTTLGVKHLRHLLTQGAESILVFVPQRTLAKPYYDLLNDPSLPAGNQVNIVTLGGLARRIVDLFWVLVKYGFKRPEKRPIFLTLETAQYYMARVVSPVIERDLLFDTIKVDRNRLYSQLLDNLNKAAVINHFEYTEVGDRLKSAWSGDPLQLRTYDDVQTCMNLFREFCLEHNLLDFSLQVEVFLKQLRHIPQVQQFMRHQHIIVENVEEDTPASHELLADLIDQAESALILYDDDAGYRRFLGASPITAKALINHCDEHRQLDKSYITPPELEAFHQDIAYTLGRASSAASYNPFELDSKRIIKRIYTYQPEMLSDFAEEIYALVEREGVDPREIVVIAPYLSDALRFSMMNRLQTLGIPVISHRPSRALREEPAARAMLTLAQLAHPSWGMKPQRFDIVYMLLETLGQVDLVRARLLTDAAFRADQLHPFDTVPILTQERVTYSVGERYDRLHQWLESYINAGEETHLDHFWSRLFGEVLSQPGFGFHDDQTPNPDKAEIAANLIESARKFRWITGDILSNSLGREYIQMVEAGVIAAQYLGAWDDEEENAVLIAPAYTFLMRNQPVSYQFWLNVGASGWAERLYQPLTNPYVLSPFWEEGRKWTDMDEQAVGQKMIYDMTLGLIRRCRERIYLGICNLSEQGYEQHGELLHVIQTILRRYHNGAE